MKFLLIFLFFCVCLIADAQVILKGRAPEFANKTISVFEYEDFFTRKRKEKVSQVIDTNGGFEITCPSSKPIYVDIFLNGIFSGVYVQPGFEYVLSFDQRGKIILVVSADKTNERVQAFENRVLGFYKSNGNKKDEKFEKFINLERTTSQNENPFLREILKYRIAELDYFLALDMHDINRVNLLERQILGSANIDNSIPDYFNFIKLYGYDRARSIQIRRAPFDYRQPLESLLKEATFIRPDSVQQLAALAILRKAYRSDWAPSKDRINYLTDSIANKVTNAKVRQIAAYVKQDGNVFSPGSKIDDFYFSTPSGETYALSSFRGKYVLIDFWFSACGPCIKNFPKLKKLKQQYADRLEIISLTPKDTPGKVASFMKKHPDYAWLFSAIDKDDLIMSYFNVFYFPTYFLVDPDGNLVKLIVSAEMENNLAEVEALIK